MQKVLMMLNITEIKNKTKYGNHDFRQAPIFEIKFVICPPIKRPAKDPIIDPNLQPPLDWSPKALIN